ncbi:MAG: tetratricopeptide repeat protein, partial [Desulfobacteraceae bacterium]|nr:tetratricopeptide repeat protein [Desulfobacteraceae bacterium]
MRITPWLTLVLLLLIVPPATAGADSANDLFAKGKQQFEAGQFAEAYNSFRGAFLQDPGNLDYSFYMGRAAFEMHNYEDAIMDYDRILIAHPDSPRVKLELARCHLELGSRELAKQYFKEVLATHPPEAVWQNIQRYLKAIEESERRNFLTGIISVGVQNDDNVRVAPSNTSISLPFSNFPLQVDGAKRDWIYNTTAVVNHVYKFVDTPWSWKSTATNYNAFYDTEKDLDINYLALTTGPVRQTDKYLWELQALVNQIDLDYDRYLGIYGASTSITLPFDKILFFVAGATFMDKNYYQDGDKDAKNIEIHGGPVLTLGKNRLGLTVGHETETAASDLNSYDRLSLGLRYDRLLPLDFAFFASAYFENTDYKEADPWFQVERADDEQQYMIGFSKVLWWFQDKRRNLAA